MEAPAKLQQNALGLTESSIMGIAGTAPVYSIAATTATLIAAVGVLSPASLLYCGLIMFGVTFAFMYLNRLNANAGASYAWVASIFSPTLGFLCGWTVLVSSAVFMVSGTIPAAVATLQLFAPDRVNDIGVVALVAAGWLAIVSAILIKGIKLTSYVQVALTAVEVVILLALVAAALVEYAHHPVRPISLAWFSPAGLTPHLFAAGALAALFFYWGWDVTVNLNEETRDGARVAGLGSLVAMLVLLALFVTFAALTLMLLSDQEIRQSGANIVFAVAEKLFPRPWSYMAVLAVMLSTIGTLETSILQFTRTMFAQGRDGSLHPRYARLHPSWNTPWLATAAIAVAGLMMLLAASRYPSISQVIQDSVNAVGIQAAFYYGLACLACAWHVWRSGKRDATALLLLIFWPLASAAFLGFIAVYGIPNFDTTANVVGIGGIAIGLVPMWLNRSRAKYGAGRVERAL
ncbi:MAG: APC family permease [Bacteroidota bacterium]